VVDAGSPPSLIPPLHPSLPSLPPALCPASRLQSLRTIWQAREERDAVFQHIEQLLHLQSPLRSPQRASREEGPGAAWGKEEEEAAAALVACPLSSPMSRAVSALAQEPYVLVGKMLVTILAASHLPQMEYFFLVVLFVGWVGVGAGCLDDVDVRFVCVSMHTHTLTHTFSLTHTHQSLRDVQCLL
jgi:hypothetical protein